MPAAASMKAMPSARSSAPPSWNGGFMTTKSRSANPSGGRRRAAQSTATPSSVRLCSAQATVAPARVLDDGAAEPLQRLPEARAALILRREGGDGRAGLQRPEGVRQDEVALQSAGRRKDDGGVSRSVRNGGDVARSGDQRRKL